MSGVGRHLVIILGFLAGLAWILVAYPSAVATWGRGLLLEVHRMLQGIV